MNNIH